jgi:hypothetical protein
MSASVVELSRLLQVPMEITSHIADRATSESGIGPRKRACIDRSDQLPDGQVRSSPQTGLWEMPTNRGSCFGSNTTLKYAERLPTPHA